jgi:hypothetical protein
MSMSMSVSMSMSMSMSMPMPMPMSMCKAANINLKLTLFQALRSSGELQPEKNGVIPKTVVNLSPYLVGLSQVGLSCLILTRLDLSCFVLSRPHIFPVEGHEGWNK